MFTSTSVVHRAAAALLGAGIILSAATGAVSADAGRDQTVQFLDKGMSTLAGPSQTTIGMMPGEPAMLAAPTDLVLVDFTPEPAANGSGLHAIGSYSGRGSAQMGHADGIGDYKAGPGCMVQCITSGVAYARGVNAELIVHTDTDARIWISVWNDDGYNAVFSSNPGSKVQYFSAMFDDLEPHTIYQAMATANDGQGYTSVASGSFTTLTRNVEVSFNTAELIEVPHGDDYFGWRVWAEGEWLETPGGVGLHAVDSELYLGSQSVFLADLPDKYLSFGVILWQVDQSDDFCGAWILPEDGPSEGTHSCTTWATALLHSSVSNVDYRPAGATSWTEHTLYRDLHMPGVGGLNFTVPVTLHVTYN